MPPRIVAHEVAHAQRVPRCLVRLDLGIRVGRPAAEHAQRVAVHTLLTDGGDDEAECSIERALRRTAPWLRHNPVLKRQQAQEERSRKLERYLHRVPE